MIGLLSFFLFIVVIQNACQYQNCPNNCFCCSSSKICISCFSGYLLYLNSTCSTYPCSVLKCLSCNQNNPYVCQYCDTGYEWNLQSKKCINKLSSNSVPNSNQNDSAGKLITVISIITGIVIFFGIMLVMIYFRKICRKIQNNIVVPEIANSLSENASYLNPQISDFTNRINCIRNQNSQIIRIQNMEKLFDSNSLSSKFDYDQQRDSCSICLQSNCNTITPCKHYFHLQCIRAWISKNRNCPICKRINIKMVEFIMCIECKNKTKMISIFSKKPQPKCQKDHFESELEIKAIQ